ncbi:kinase-like domain-containing protein [Lineolata rhizophorae]|uniref:Kinase-like domain-containing protein n=1 Tax=Lineolata rhizophorae TaxID=578093 RepID=A0A6A6P3R4_9PEZI|nr:kinase-like domain-containing protein [Lineolata rhizophorae]
MSSDQFKARTMKRKNVKGLALSAPAAKSPAPSAGDAQIPGAIGNENRGDTLEIGVEFRLDLRAEDLIVIKELGAGNGGTVSKVQHAATKVIMARKIIHVEAKKEVRKRIVRELQIMFECNSPYIVSFYGAFMNDTGDVIMCMEYMDCGSLDSISKNFGPVRVDVLGKIAESVLGGLTYLYRTHKIMHRDIKPSNVLVNSKGQIKLCDFGVSSELEGSIAETFVGTGTYMAPERIQGSPYTVKSDVWSVGLTLMELAIGKFPFNNDFGDAEDDGPNGGGPQGILDLLQRIVLEPAPKLPESDAFPSILDDMIGKCLMKDPADRPTPQQLYDEDAFIEAAKRTPVDLQSWAVSMMERQHRKSHLIQLPSNSPSTRSLLQKDPSSATTTPHAPPPPSSSSTAEPTPTSIDIPIGGPPREDSRPTYPIRTSSASQVLSSEKGPSMALPIRPAPTGPLPQVPPRKVGS